MKIKHARLEKIELVPYMSHLKDGLRLSKYQRANGMANLPKTKTIEIRRNKAQIFKKVASQS